MIYIEHYIKSIREFYDSGLIKIIINVNIELINMSKLKVDRFIRKDK